MHRYLCCGPIIPRAASSGSWFLNAAYLPLTGAPERAVQDQAWTGKVLGDSQMIIGHVVSGNHNYQNEKYPRARMPVICQQMLTPGESQSRWETSECVDSLSNKYLTQGHDAVKTHQWSGLNPSACEAETGGFLFKVSLVYRASRVCVREETNKQKQRRRTTWINLIDNI